MQKVTKNTFTGGLNTDLDPQIIPQDSYIDAINVSLTEDGKFFALKNLNGTADFATVYSGIDTNQKVLGLYLNKYSINGKKGVKAFTVFTYNTSSRVYEIVLIGKESAPSWSLGSKLVLYSKTLSASESTEFETADPIIDAVIYTENAVDTLYFTDGYHEIRRIVCDITTSGFTTFTEAQLSLLRRGGSAEIHDINQFTGGSLLCGTYQYAVRLFNNDTSTYTKWSLLTNPVHVYNTDEFKTTAGIGQSGSVYNSLGIRMSLEDSINFTHYQLAVVENVVALENAAQQASVLSPQAITPSTTSYIFIHKTNRKINTIDLSDIVVDRAAIKSVRALQVKNNRLFAGNVSYHDLEYNNGNPTATGSVIAATAGLVQNYYDTPSNSSKRKGYFRDEVYRYAITYFDEYYNFSRPKVLDLSSVTNNKIAGGNIDLKFPKRSDGNQWALMDSSDRPRALGVSLTLDNHPTWAKGFIILRAKRIKDILFQSPFIPVAEIVGMKADSVYPSEYVEIENWGTGSTTSLSYPTGSVTTAENAQPMNPLGTMMPKNFFWPMVRKTNYTKNEGVSWNYWNINSSTGALGTSSSGYGPLHYRIVFPPEGILDFSNDLTNSNRQYNFTNNHEYELVDVAHVKVQVRSFEPVSDGEHIDTNIDGVFYAVKNADYHYDANYTAGKNFSALKSVETTGTIEDYELFDNFSEGGIVGGNWFGKYDHLVTPGADWGTPADNLRMAVVRLKDPTLDATYSASTLYSFAQYTCAGGSIPSTYFEADSSITNKYLNEYSGYTGSKYANLVEIVNIKQGLSDDRYGDSEALHEFISTGAVHVFTAGELTTVEAGTTLPITTEVWGGDCFINMCNYKLTTGYYSIAGLGAAWTDVDGIDQVDKWGRFYGNDVLDKIYDIPVGVRGVGTSVSVLLESEYNLNVQDSNVYSNDSSITKNISLSANNSGLVRQPFNYFYNINLVKENDQKIFIPYQSFENNVNEFNSRIVYSNQKIYQADVDGFDLFNALDFYDLDETFGQIISLPRAGDRVHAVQENGISYLPIGANVLETSDASTISVRSSEVLGTPLYISTIYGAQRTSLVEQASDSFYVLDYSRRALLNVGQQITNISESGFVSGLNEMLPTTLSPSYDFDLIYDAANKQVLVTRNELAEQMRCFVYSERLGKWITKISTASSDSKILRGSGLEDGLFVAAQDNSGNLILSEMYAGSPDNFFGNTPTSYVRFIVNPEVEFPKVFDNFVFYSSRRLGTVDVSIENEGGLTEQTLVGMDLDKDQREGTYKIKILRDASGARLRGIHSTVSVYWPADSGTQALSAVATKYRLSQRII